MKPTLQQYKEVTQARAALTMFMAEALMAAMGGPLEWDAAEEKLRPEWKKVIGYLISIETELEDQMADEKEDAA